MEEGRSGEGVSNDLVQGARGPHGLAFFFCATWLSVPPSIHQKGQRVKMKSGDGILLAIALSAAAAFGQGTILWDEAVNGPLSNDAQFPTSLQPLTLGTNSLMGAVELTPHGANWGHDEDVFIITVPADMRVGMIGASADRSTSAWIGNPSFLTEYGFAIISSGGNLLPLWELTSLAPGTYGMVLVDSDFQPYPTAASYRLDFVVEAIPEPASVCLLLGGLGWLGIRARSKS